MSMRKTFFMLAIAGALVACGDPEPVDPGTDAQTPDGGPGDDAGGGDDDGGTAGGTPSGSCNTYCTLVTTNCTGDNAVYADMADCLAYCAASEWPEGTEGATSGNTLACRIYHGGAPAAGEPEVHCLHVGPTGGATCGTVDFRTETTGARVDRMGMPAVSTALIPSGRKNAYNDANPQDDADGDFVGDLATSLAGIHTALDDDLAGLSLDACSMTNDAAGVPVVPGVTLPECFGQTVGAGGPTVASLVLPDTLHIDPTAPAGFPNGRMLADPVIDVTLGVILLDLDGSCGAGDCSAATLAGVPVNPPENDIAEGVFLTTFPYLHPAHVP